MKNLLLFSLITIFACTEKKSSTSDYFVELEEIKNDYTPNPDVLPHLIELNDQEIYVSQNELDIDPLIIKVLEYKENKSKTEENKEVVRNEYHNLMEKAANLDGNMLAYINDYLHPLMDKMDLFLDDSTDENYNSLKDYLGDYFLIFRNGSKNIDSEDSEKMEKINE